MSYYLFIYLITLPDTDVVMTLLQYFVCCITPSFKTNVWHSIEQRTMHPLNNGLYVSKYGIFAKGRHFKHIT